MPRGKPTFRGRPPAPAPPPAMARLGLGVLAWEDLWEVRDAATGDCVGSWCATTGSLRVLVRKPGQPPRDVVLVVRTAAAVATAFGELQGRTAT